MSADTRHAEKAPTSGLAGAIERGRMARPDWVREGILLAAPDFAARFGVAPSDLPDLEGGGELFSVAVENETLYLAELLKFSRADVAALCAALAGADSATKVVFIMRQHGALAGRTVAEAAALGKMAEVLHLARAWLRS